MEDIQVNVDDNDLNKYLSSTSGYNQELVPFTNLQDYYNFPYLGGKDYMGNKRVPN